MRLHLAQARSNLRPRGRKTDFRDAQRIVSRLLSGDLILSYVPEAERRPWRTLTRTQGGPGAVAKPTRKSSREVQTRTACQRAGSQGRMAEGAHFRSARGLRRRRQGFPYSRSPATRIDGW